nr:beta' subunit of RNA polymerase [Microspora sp. UTEX LB472]
MKLKQLKTIELLSLNSLKNQKLIFFKEFKIKIRGVIKKNLLSNRVMKLNSLTNSSFTCSKYNALFWKNGINFKQNQYFFLFLITNNKKKSLLKSTTNFQNENNEGLFRKQEKSISTIEHQKNGNEIISRPLKKKKISISPEEFYLEKAKSFYSSYSKLYEINQITINLASSERIRYWAEKILPNQKIIGRVTNANTLHYKSFKPQKGGLFCERIFGPLKDFECACGKSQKKVEQIFMPNQTSDAKNIKIWPIVTSQTTKVNMEETLHSENTLNIKKTSNNNTEMYDNEVQETEERKFCPECDVEYTWSVMRRYQLGYIQLIAPVTHLWYLKGTPSYLSLLLNMKKKDLEAIIYCSESMTLEAAWNHKFILSESPSNLFMSWQKLIKSEDNQEKETSLFAPFSNSETKKPLIFFSNKCLQVQSKSNNQLEITTSAGIQSVSTYTEKLNFVKNSKNILYIPQSIYLKKLFQKNLLPQRLTNWRFFTKPYFALSLNSSAISFVQSANLASSNTLLSNLNGRNQDLIYSNNKLIKQLSLNFSNKTTEWLFNANNLPMPIYTLSKLEYLGQKEVLNIFVQRSWKVFYEKSYVLAYKKAIQIYKKSFTSSLLDFCIETKEQIDSHPKLSNYLEKWRKIIRPKKQFKTSKKYNKKATNKTKQFIFLKKQSFLGRLYFVKQKLKFIPLKLKPTTFDFFISKTTKSEEKRFFSFLKIIKFYFKKSVLQFFLNLNNLPKLKLIPFKNLNSKKIAILQATHLSTKILHHSKYLISLLSNEITKHIIKLLLKADLKQKFLHDVFVNNSFNLQSIARTEKKGSFRRSINKVSNMLPLVYVSNLTRQTFKRSKQNQKFVKKLSPDPNKLDRNERIKRTVIPSKNYLCIKELMRQTLYKKNLLINGSIAILKLDYLSNISEKPKNLSNSKIFSNNLKTKIFNLKKKNLQAYYLAHKFHLKANKELFFKSLVKHKKGSKSKFDLNFDINKSTIKRFQVNKENKPKSHIWKRRNKLKNSSSKVKSKLNFTQILENKDIFNNIYSLSHTFNWKKEKDWRAFFFYISVSPNYEDSPIFHYQNRVPNSDTPTLVGAGIIQKLLAEYHVEELKKMDKQNRIQLYEFTQELNELKKFVRLGLADKLDELRYKEIFQNRNKLIRRLKLTRVLYQKKSDPKSMILSTLPVLPPDLRPIIKIEGQIAASDLNRFYQRILYRNERLKKFLKDPSTRYSYEMKFTQRLLQESVDNLISNGKGKVAAEKDSRGRPLKSLSDILKGKEGRFRQHLLGKRVDYSGRSVIVVGPKLKMHQCGLPKEMALELFLPFLLKRLIHSKMARTIIGAKTIIQSNPTLTLEILNEVMQNHPILLNRAPTLHRLGIQAFQAKLVEGRAILLHPLVCPAFNADFDGDQMAVHVPITVEARAEAWKLMFSRGNLLSPATGDPILLPSQDMVLGCYYLTTESLKYQQLSNLYFSNSQQVMRAYYQGILPQKMHLHSIIWLKFPVITINGKNSLGSFFTGEAKQFNLISKFILQNKRNEDLEAYKIQRTKNKEKQETARQIGPNLKSSIDMFENDHNNEEPIEIRIEKKGSWKEISKKMQQRFDKNNLLISRYVRTTVGRVIFNLIIQDCMG